VLDNLLTEFVETTAGENNPPFSRQHDYKQVIESKERLVNEWKALTPEERKAFGDKMPRFFREKGLLDPASSEVAPSKNLHLLNQEVNERIRSHDRFGLLPINDLHFEQSMLELVENVENTEHIRDLYRIRKQATGKGRNSGINAEEASRLKNCMRQGRELYQSGRAGALMVKPLNFFYSLTAYAYAIILLNNPIRYTLDSLPGSHGVNYIPDGMKTQFGGDMPQGTFSDLMCAFPTLHTKNRDFELIQDNTESILAFFSVRNTVNVGTLMSMVPEIREYFRLLTGRNGRTHALQVSMGSDPRNIKWEFQVGDGEVKPSKSDLENAFPGFDITERHGKFIATVPASDSHKVRASIYADARGELWYVENPFYPVLLPEICIHFILTNTFSNLMRYSPDRWGSVLLNEVNSDWSLIARKYLSAFENKFPLLVLRSISKYYPYVVES
jgi:hypothetical protein